LLIRYLVPRYGIFGAAWSTTITVTVFNTIKGIYLWKKLQMVPVSKNTLLVIVAAMPPLAAGYFFPHLFDETVKNYFYISIDALLRGSVIFIAYALMLLWLRPSKDLEEYLASVKKNKRLF
jgi:O-antigen/teichoic acid export membrane protein